MKFGAEWAEKVKSYFECDFEGTGMSKVVASLMNAWKRGNENSKDTNEMNDSTPSKRRKIDL